VVLRSANILVLPTQGQQSLASVPSKLIAYLMAGKPVIALAVPGSDIARIVREAACGWVIRPNRPNLLAGQIKCVYAMPKDNLDQRAEAGRKYALSHFTREACLPRVIELVKAIGIRRDRDLAAS
jgi:colanic acid biosynthesis glycosyl transferase WcaI